MQGGFLPNSPSLDDILGQVGRGEGWAGLKMEGAANKGGGAADDLALAFAKVYADPAGRRVFEAMLDQTLRRSPYMNNENAQLTLEQQTAYGLERKGQNSLMIWCLSMVHKGQQSGAPSKSKKKK